MSVIEKIKRDIKDLLHVQDKKAFLKKNIPYLAFFYLGNIFSHHANSYVVGDLIDRLFQSVLEIETMNYLPSFNPMDLLVGFILAVLVKLIIYNKGKNAKKFRQGDLLVTGVGTIGVPLLIENDEALYFKDGNVIWFQNKNYVDGYFLYYSFINSNIQNFIHSVAGIGTVATYTIDNGRKTPICLPNHDEQYMIGNLLKQVDRRIILQQKKLKLLKLQKQGFMQQMFI